MHWYYDDHADKKRKEMFTGRLEFCLEILKHIPEKGFVTVRHYGFYHQKCNGKLDKLNESLGKEGRKHRNRRQRRRDKQEGLHRASYRWLCINTFRQHTQVQLRDEDGVEVQQAPEEARPCSEGEGRVQAHREDEGSQIGQAEAEEAAAAGAVRHAAAVLKASLPANRARPQAFI